MLHPGKHRRKRGVNQAARVAGQPVSDRHDPERVAREDIESVLLEAGYRRAVELLRAAGCGPRCYFIDDGGRECEVAC